MEINFDEPIGKYFKLKDLIYSTTATDYGINNTPGVDGNHSQIVENLRALMDNVVDKIGDTYPDLIITSGFRCIELNTHSDIGGSKNSQHVWGQAADIQVPGLTTAQLYNWVHNNIKVWDQIVWEYPENGEKSWVHVSYSRWRDRRKTTLASNLDKFHNLYGGIRTGGNNQYQEEIGLAKIV